MRTSRAHDDRVALVTQRRLEALATELEALRAGAPAVAATPTEPAPPAAPVDLAGTAAPSSLGPGRHARRPVSPAGRLAGWVADRLPLAVRGSVHLGSAQLGLVALVVGVGLLATAWWVVRAGGAAGEVVPPRPVAAAVTAVPGTAAGTASGTAAELPGHSSAAPAGGSDGVTGGSGLVVVDVAGKVRRPGIVVLPVGSRVVDALRAAGGVRRSVDLTALNLARLLTDGEQVLVGTSAAPFAGAPGPAAPGGPGASGPLVNLNTADQTTLETLPGVGPVTAGAIIEWRTEHGGFTAVEELLEVPGIGDATLAELSPHVTI